MDAVVLAAGEGTRLRPLTADRPKALVEVAGDPLLAHCFRALAPLVDEFVVVVGYRGEMIRERFGDAFEGIPVTYVEQPEPLGLAHALRQADDELDGQFLLLHGDNVVDDDLSRLVDRFEATDASVACLVEEVSEAEARTTGVFELEDGEVVGLVEKPENPPSRLALTGAFVCAPAALHACHVVRPSERGEYELTDALDLLVYAGHGIETVELAGWRCNVNTPADVERVERYLSSSGS